MLLFVWRHMTAYALIGDLCSEENVFTLFTVPLQASQDAQRPNSSSHVGKGRQMRRCGGRAGGAGRWRGGPQAGEMEPAAHGHHLLRHHSGHPGRRHWVRYQVVCTFVALWRVQWQHMHTDKAMWIEDCQIVSMLHLVSPCRDALKDGSWWKVAARAAVSRFLAPCL